MNSFAFSDHHPFVEYLIFLLVFGLSALLLRRSSMRSAVIRTQEWLMGAVRSANGFPEYSNVSDIHRIEVVRIIVGLIAAYRYGEILFASIYLDNATAIMWSLAAVVLSILVALGLFTHVAIFLLMSSSNILIDNFIGASTLGTMVLSVVLLMCLLAPAGTALSIDSRLVRKGGRTAGLIQSLWVFGSNSSSGRIIIAKLAALFAYSCICLYSVTWHLNDDAWLSGYVISWTLLSPAANPKYSGLVWWFYETMPWLAVNLGRVACYGMFIWYVAILPGVFIGGLFLRIVVIWGLAFFLVSTFVLPLSYLGIYELLFWFALFARSTVFGGKENQIMIFYDDRCNLCDRTIKFLAFIDVFHVLSFLPIRSNLELAGRYGITLESGLKDLIGVHSRLSETYRGYCLYSKLSRIVFVLWPLFPFLLLGQITRVGPAIYRWIAERRIRLFGVCTFSDVPKRAVHRVSDSEEIKGQSIANLAIFLTLVILSLAFLVRLPIQGSHTQENWLSYSSRMLLGATPIAFGIGKINVFNLQDLKVFSGVTYFLSSPTSIDSLHEGLPDSSALVRLVMDDAQRYQFIAHQRRMSRVNLECDREGWEKLAPIVAQTAKMNNYELETIIALQLKYPWPSDEDLASYRIEHNDGPKALCAVNINVKTAEVTNLRFYQPGVDRVMRQKGLSSVLLAEYAEMATGYPQVLDSTFLRTLVAASPSNSTSIALREELETLGRDSWGVFNVDHLARTLAFEAAWPDVLSQDDLIPSADMCNVGIALGENLLSSPGFPLAIRDSFKEKLAEMQLMKRRQDFLNCQYAALEFRRSWFALILKPSTV